MISTEKQQIYRHYHEAKLININMLQVKKYCLLIKVELRNKLSLIILLYKKFLKNKKRQMKIKVKAIQEHGR